jgi:hypothetical protein
VKARRQIAQELIALYERPQPRVRDAESDRSSPSLSREHCGTRNVRCIPDKDQVRPMVANRPTDQTRRAKRCEGRTERPSRALGEKRQLSQHPRIGGECSPTATRGEHGHLVSTGEPLDGVSTANLIAADGDRRIEIANYEDAHAMRLTSYGFTRAQATMRAARWIRADAQLA